jgi:peroxiredoxin
MKYPQCPSWMRMTLLSAAAYHMLWGAFVALFPQALFKWLDFDTANYPQFWQCLGILSAVYSLGYLITAMNPVRYWPIVLLGFLDKIFKTLVLGVASYRGELPSELGILIVALDLIWCLPFGLILKYVYEVELEEPWLGKPLSVEDALRQYNTVNGYNLHEISQQGRLLIVFLRHTGCSFAREMLNDLRRARHMLEEIHVRTVLVTLGDIDQDAQIIKKYGCDIFDVAHDPDRELYRAFGLKRGSISQLLGFKVWQRAWQVFAEERHGIALPTGDACQMPGVFLVEYGKIKDDLRPISLADRIDFTAFAG